LIARELDAGRPVGIGFYISGMSARKSYARTIYTFPLHTNDSHVVLVTGYAVYRGMHMFKIRNSWGSENLGAGMINGNPLIGVLYDSDMCRVREVTSVVAPGEQRPQGMSRVFSPPDN